MEFWNTATAHRHDRLAQQLTARRQRPQPYPEEYWQRLPAAGRLIGRICVRAAFV